MERYESLMSYINRYGVADDSAVEVRAAGAFNTSVQYSDAIDLRLSPGGLAVWVVITDITGITQVDVYAVTSDQPSGGLAFDAFVKSDDNIADGLFTAKTYMMRLTTTDSTLAVGVNGPFRLPQVAGAIKIAVVANSNTGSYSLSAQRFA